jgi:hypothetical protein
VKRCPSIGRILFRQSTRCAAIYFTATKACTRKMISRLCLRRSGF